MVDVQTWVPEGFVEGRHPRISAALDLRINRGRRGPIRILARTKDGACGEELDAFFAARPAWGARKRLPGLYELHVMADDLGLLLENTAVFSWFDVSGRLTGVKLEDEGALATVKVAVADSGLAAVKEHIASLGGKVAGGGAGEVLARVPAGSVAEVLWCEHVEALDVVG